MRILTLNYGSKTLKWAVFVNGHRVETGKGACATEDALRSVLNATVAAAAQRYLPLDGVAHRVVHGLTRTEPAVITGLVLSDIKSATRFSPVHNERALVGIECTRTWAERHVAVFDTTFHAEMPEVARQYGLHCRLYEKHGVRRYGFHGLAFAAMVRRLTQLMDKPREQINAVLLQLGGGASACAIRRGRSIDTSMGMTPLEGLIMETRCGDIDPGIVLALWRAGFDLETVERILTEDSGICGLGSWESTAECVERAEKGDRFAHRALQLYAYRVRKYIGAYHAIVGGAEALVFGGGVGENSPFVRSLVCQGLEHLGIVIDEGRNAANAEEISAGDAAIRTFVIRVDEERELYRAAVEVLTPARGGPPDPPPAPDGPTNAP